MGKSVLVFISHSSEDKEDYIEPIVNDLENCYINVWIDKRKIVPGDNLRKSILRDGLDKADVALIFFTEKSLKSSWVDREIKHVLREEAKKGNNFDLKKIISIFDSQNTYEQISERYPELTDDLLHLMPVEYSKTDLGKLISAIWSKYLDLQGGDIESQKQLLSKEKEIFQNEKEIHQLKLKLQDAKSKNSESKLNEEFEVYLNSGKLDGFLSVKDDLLIHHTIRNNKVKNLSDVIAFELMDYVNLEIVSLTSKGKDFYKWYIIEKENKNIKK